MATDRRKFLCRSLGWLAPLVAAGHVRGFQTPDAERTAAELLTPATHRAVERGLAFLAGRQQEEGSFGPVGYARNPAVCALAGMAFMSAGNTPGRGPYGGVVDRCIDFVLTNTRDDGFIFVEGATSHGPMYGHGFATMFLAECYGMTMRPDIRQKLSLAINVIIHSQNREGGWRYQPTPQDADVSVTVCQVMALRAARNAGLYVPPETIERCIDYIKRCQNADGGFMYMIHGGQSAFPRSAAGVVALFSAGLYDTPEIHKGIEYLVRHAPRGAFHRESHYFYGHYYAVQAMWHYGGRPWAQWYPAVRDELLTRQRDDGAWPDAICAEYGTAMACLILQMPNNYLPIFQR